MQTLKIVKQSYFFFLTSPKRFQSNTSGPVKSLQIDEGTSKESIAQTTPQPIKPTMPPTSRPSTGLSNDEVVADETESTTPWEQHPEKESIESEGRRPDTKPFKDGDEAFENELESSKNWGKHPEKESIEEEGRRPDMKPFKDEVEKDAVVAENRADRIALLSEASDGKENDVSDKVSDDDSIDAASKEAPYQSEVLNASPLKPRPRLVTPFRGRCPVCREYS